MDTLAVAAVLTAALLHAVWNAIAHAITDRLVGFALIGAGGTAIGALAAPFAGTPDPAAWPALLVSVSLHIAYMGGLMLCYRLGDFGQVYPLARGTAPWAVALAAAALLGEHLPPVRLCGVLVVSAGLCALAFAHGRPTRARLPAIGAALATGLMIAAYTLVDGFGVRASGDPLAYVSWMMLLQGPFYGLVALVVRRGRLTAQVRPVWRIGLLGGALSTTAYGLVLWAQTIGTLAGVAALRETGIVFGALIGTVFFGERFGRVRAAAAAGVAIGAVLLNA
ncbi:DMT family transporter [Streptomonospora salina]|uniref:Drug/metabolite transporter (DMT)-like permease n=1 Tax=Streptomonospora salina TaxID=104205 RepID=A0A841E7J5_9ACTN|nr:DMT family transporter [Streptomonospora salina]MBB5999115.1 drug/metabolite transporter (DMT)-like permease [Streptomonospora salina]